MLLRGRVKTAHEYVKSSKFCLINEEVRNKLGDGNQKCISDFRRVVWEIESVRTLEAGVSQKRARGEYIWAYVFSTWLIKQTKNVNTMYRDI